MLSFGVSLAGTRATDHLRVAPATQKSSVAARALTPSICFEKPFLLL